jgi:hypothetical protein
VPASKCGRVPTRLGHSGLSTQPSPRVQVLRQADRNPPGVLAAEWQISEIVFTGAEVRLVENAFELRRQRAVVADGPRELGIAAASCAYLLTLGALNAGARNRNGLTPVFGQRQHLLERQWTCRYARGRLGTGGRHGDRQCTDNHCCNNVRNARRHPDRLHGSFVKLVRGSTGR